MPTSRICAMQPQGRLPQFAATATAHPGPSHAAIPRCFLYKFGLDEFIKKFRCLSSDPLHPRNDPPLILLPPSSLSTSPLPLPRLGPPFTLPLLCQNKVHWENTCTRTRSGNTEATALRTARANGFQNIYPRNT